MHPATYTGDHHLYDRLSLSIPTRRIAAPSAHFLVQHDETRCRPFGIFVVLRVDAHGRQHYVGAQLSNPSLDDCVRLARTSIATHSMFRVDPTLPEELVVRRVSAEDQVVVRV